MLPSKSILLLPNVKINVDENFNLRLNPYGATTRDVTSKNISYPLEVGVSLKVKKTVLYALFVY